MEHAGHYSERIHRQRDEQLDALIRELHEDGECGGVDDGCYICCKKAVLKDIKKIVREEVEKADSSED